MFSVVAWGSLFTVNVKLRNLLNYLKGYDCDLEQLTRKAVQGHAFLCYFLWR